MGCSVLLLEYDSVGGFGMLDVVFGVLLGGADVSFRLLLALVGCSVLLLEYDSVGGFGMLGVVFGVLLGRAGVLALVGCSVLY